MRPVVNLLHGHHTMLASCSETALSMAGWLPESADVTFFGCWCIGVGEFVNQSAASAASSDQVKFQDVIKSAAGLAQPPCVGPAVAGDLITFFVCFSYVLQKT